MIAAQTKAFASQAFDIHFVRASLSSYVLLKRSLTSVVALLFWKVKGKFFCISRNFWFLSKGRFCLFSFRWFRMGTNPFTGAEDWQYTGGYFDRKYTDCPNIYWHKKERNSLCFWKMFTLFLGISNLCDLKTGQVIQTGTVSQLEQTVKRLWTCSAGEF